MHILYPIVMLIVLAITVRIVWKTIIRKNFPELEVLEKSDEVDALAQAAEMAKKVDLKKAQKDKKTLKTFSKESKK